MISRVPAVAALLVAFAVLASACATSTTGTAAGPTGALSSASGGSSASAFPSATVPSSANSGTPNSQPIPSSIAPLPTSSVPTTVPGTWSVATARQKYLSFVRAGNLHVAQLNTLYANKKVSVARFTNLCATLAVDQTGFAKNLQEGKWPATVQPLIDKFVPAVISVGYSYIRCSDAKTVAKAKSILATSTDTTPLANAVRAALNLPKVKQ